MRVCYFGTYRAGYVRNRLMIDRLRSRGVEVIECHEQLWRGFEDREQSARHGWRRPGFWWRVLSVYWRLFWKGLRTRGYDIMIVGYPGQPDLPLAWLLSRLRGTYLVWDVLMSLVLIAEERGFSERSPAALKLLGAIERLSLKLPDRLIIDTQAYADWFQGRYGLDNQRIRLLPLGADDRIFRPMEPSGQNTNEFVCLYYGSFLKSHGIQIILDAAKMLKGQPNIRFMMIGEGPFRAQAENYVDEHELENVRFSGWIEPAHLVQMIGDAHLCLGTFGVTPQALITMQNKIHEPLACARPVLTGDSPAIREVLEHEEHIFLCPRQDATALARGIFRLFEDQSLRVRIGEQGHIYYKEHLAFDRLAGRLVNILEDLADSRKQTA